MVTHRLVVVRNVLAAATLLGLLAACATGPEIRVQSTPDLDLSRYATYNFVTHPGTDRGNYRSITTRYLEEAVDRQMSARGFQKTRNPQLLIDFHTQLRNRLQGTMGPGPGPGWGWGAGWGWGWGGWGPGWWGPGPWGWGTYGGDIEAYTEGTLTIDVIDANTKDAIWSGSAVSRVTRAAYEHPQAAVDQTVDYIFAKFPKQPPRAAQAQ